MLRTRECIAVFKVKKEDLKRRIETKSRLFEDCDRQFKKHAKYLTDLMVSYLNGTLRIESLNFVKFVVKRVHTLELCSLYFLSSAAFLENLFRLPQEWWGGVI